MVFKLCDVSSDDVAYYDMPVRWLNREGAFIDTVD